MTAHDMPDALDQVTQRVVPASTAQASASGPNSVFALGGTPSDDEPADAADDSAATEWEQRALDTLQACGALSCVQLQEALGCTRSRATAVLASLRAVGVIMAVRKEGVVPFYGLANAAPTGGFKGWLQRKGEADASGRAPRAKRGRKPGRSTPATAAAPAHAELVPLPKAPPQPDLKLGLFSDGSLELQADGQVLRLDAARTRRLIDSLLRFDAVLATGGF